MCCADIEHDIPLADEPGAENHGLFFALSAVKPVTLMPKRMQDNFLAGPLMPDGYIAEVHPAEQRNQGVPEGRAVGQIFYRPMHFFHAR